MRKLLTSTLGLFLAVLFVGGCAPAGGLDSGSGTLRAGLSVGIQAAGGGGNGGGRGGNLVSEMDQIVVSVSAVAAHASGGGWVSVSETPALVDLLRLQDHADELGFANLPAGKITQIRLYVADDGLSHTVDKDGVTRLLTIPSGLQTGVKLKGPFDLGECERGSAVALIDLEKSILVHARGDHEDLILRPTIHRTEYTAVPADICEPGPGDEGDIPPGSETGTPDDGTDDGTPGSEDGTCPPNTEGCEAGVPGDSGTDGTGDGSGDGTVDGGDTGTGTGTGDTGSGDTGTGGDAGTGGDGTGTGVGDGTTGDTGTDPGDECAPVVTEFGLVDPCA